MGFLHLDLQTVISSAIAAGESSISVILVLFYGYISNKTGLLSDNGEKSISKLCVNLFLPSLLLTTMGSHISLETLINYWPLVALPVVILSITFLIGQFITVYLGEPAYIIPGMVFNNVTSLPLLLLAAIAQSDVLIPLANPGETVNQAVVRARAYILLHGIVHNIGRFAFGPVMLRSSTSSATAQKVSSDAVVTPKKQKSISFVENTSSQQQQQETTAATSTNVNQDQDGEAPTEHTSLFRGQYAGAGSENSYGGTSNTSGDNTLSEDAKKLYFYKRARQLSRKSIDFDETRALLRGYFVEESNEGGNQEGEEPQHHRHYSHHNRHQRDDLEDSPAVGGVANGTPISPLIGGQGSEETSNTTKKDTKKDDEEDPGYRSNNNNTNTGGIIGNGDNVIEGENEDAIAGYSSSEESSTLEQKEKSFYSVLPQSVVDVIESLKPAKGSRTQRVWKFVSQFLNPAVIAALVAVVIGVIPSLHWFFFDYSVIATSFTPSVTNIGELYPALQLFALGSKLTSSPEIPTRKTTIFWISSVRFLIAPIISITTVWLMIQYAPPNIWPHDRMLNFILMITPVGPPAITLAAVAEIAGVPKKEVSAISRMLLYMYAIAPLVAPTVAVALSIAYKI